MSTLIIGRFKSVTFEGVGTLVIGYISRRKARKRRQCLRKSSAGSEEPEKILPSFWEPLLDSWRRVRLPDPRGRTMLVMQLCVSVKLDVLANPEM